MPGISRRTCYLAITGLLALSASAPAQMTPLTPVDENVADVSPLRTSLIRLEPDHGWATGFERVYESPLYPDRFIRVHGAVWAMFPKSEYLQTEDGLLPLIPASAEFFIGPPPLMLATPAAAAPSPNYVSLLAPSRYLGADNQRDSRATWTPARARPEAPAPARVTIWSSSDYRSRRLDAILRQAALSDGG